MQAKANLNEINEAGLTPLMMACVMGNTDLAQALLDAQGPTHKLNKRVQVIRRLTWPNKQITPHSLP